MNLQYSRTVKTTKGFATVTGYKIICSKVKILKRQTVTTSVLFTVNVVEKGLRYNIRNSSHHLGPPGIIVTTQSTLKHLVDLSLRLRSAQCLKADWEVTIIPWGPKWCVLFLKPGQSAFKTISDFWSQIAVFRVTGYYRYTVIKIDSILWPNFHCLRGWSLKAGYFTLLHRQHESQSS